MRSTIISAVIALATGALAAPAARTTTAQAAFAENPTAYVKGFKDPTVQSSVGGKAFCISGTVEVKASAENTHINTPEPANQTAVTELLLENFQIDTTLAQRLTGNKTQVSGNFNIYSQLCFPNTGINTETVQFLIHGAGFDRIYWNVAPGYSYVDAAAEHGYTTFLYDRLGVGLSDHPDPIQIVQHELQVAIAHELVQLLRTGGISAHAFKKVVGVGHSLGSFQTSGVTSKYPDDFDAAVLTGFSPDVSGTNIAFAGVGLIPASEGDPRRFADLPNGYLTSDSIVGTQFFFFRVPGFDQALLDLADTLKQTITLGEYLTTTGANSTKFTGPIDVVNGLNDLPNCHGDCLYPENKAAAVKGAFYPAARNSTWYLAPETGHGLNMHYSAAAAYEHIQTFVKNSGL